MAQIAEVVSCEPTRFARANVAIGRAIADDDERPAWNESDFFGEKFGSR